MDSGVSASSPTYTYDGNGNRLTRTGGVGGFEDQAFTYQAGSNVVASYKLGSGAVHTVDSDSMGNVEDPGTGPIMGYDDGGRLNSIWDGAGSTGLLTLYNGMGELARTRTAVQDPCSVTDVLLAMEYFTFLPDGRALSLASENLWRTQYDFVWLDNIPVAQFMDSYDTSGTYQGTTVTYLHADSLGTPRLGTDASKQISWRWQSDGFGTSAPTGSATVRLRLPGQIDLGLGGINYNYYRDYMPEWGRYVESDPIGLAGGSFSTYAYVNGNPVLLIDPYGLWDWPSLPQGVVNASAGFGDTLSFGLTNQIRNWQGTNGVVDKCSNTYTAGQLAAIALDIGLGGAAGMAASEANAGRAGYEFSHWIPNRFGGPRSPWNGNYVSQELHYLTDPYRFPPGWQQYGDKLPAALQQLLRIPGVYPGAAAGGAAGAASAASQSCGCQK